jgi:uncharacterized protein (TIGR02117 family)
MEVEPNDQVPVPFDSASANSAVAGAELKGQLKRSFLGKCWRLIRWPLAIIVFPVLLYVAAALIGAWIPDNGDFVPKANGIEVYIYSGDIHSDVILPLVNDQKDWRENFPLSSFASDRQDFTHISFGWGSREFYLDTPTWNDLEVSTALNVLLTPSESVVHVEMVQLQPVISSSLMKTKITEQQYRDMVKFVQASFDRNSGVPSSELKPTPIADAGYNDRDNFYPAVGSYHLFRTCNCWAGDALRASGIKVGKFTPLPKSVFWHLEP